MDVLIDPAALANRLDKLAGLEWAEVAGLLRDQIELPELPEERMPADRLAVLTRVVSDALDAYEDALAEFEGVARDALDALLDVAPGLASAEFRKRHVDPYAVDVMWRKWGIKVPTMQRLRERMAAGGGLGE